MGVHGDDEYVPAQDVIDCCKVYSEMILRWCGVVGEGQ
jgi:acetylornithine deacetylase/succinyl-diaminopimelate desuccinylase-like protein